MTDATHTLLTVSGMHCAGCAGRVERALNAAPGVLGATVSLASGAARVQHGPGQDAAGLAAVLTAAGYPATLRAAGAPPAPAETGTERRRFVLAALLTLPVFLAEMGGHLVPAVHHALHAAVGTQALWLAQMALTVAVLAGPGRDFFRIGIPALLRGAPEMNSLVALGAGAALAYSVVVTLAPGLLPENARQVWFEAAAVIVTLILMGRWLEARARGEAGAAIRALVALAPDSARLVGSDGTETVTPVAALLPGDRVRLVAGERVATDGVVEAGTGRIDESMLTGEPVPVAKAPGDPVTGGTVNGPAALVYRVTAVGADTALARIVAMVDEAQATKLPVQALVDRITRVFVPAVMALSALTLALWLAFGPGLAEAVVAAVGVLIIACPCAMGLAVPVSIMVGTGRAAQQGILFRRGEALQRLARARVVGFDKTGTLTLGRPALTAIRTLGIAEAEALRLTAAAEAQSDHPLARALVAAAPAPPPPAHDVVAEAGHGLTATVEGRALVIGNRAALDRAGVAPEAALLAAAEGWADKGATVVHLAVDGAHRAAFALADPARPDSAEAVADLHALGLRTAMISGDAPAAARAAGAALGIDDVQGGVLPAGKRDAVAAMGPGSVFVGDGINDAPALAAADTGIAIGTGTDVAIASADVVLGSGDPRGVARAIGLSRAVMRNIRQNLFWAFAYNVALIPVAMGALVPLGGPALSPMLGAGAMALSSVFVVANALRLRRA